MLVDLAQHEGLARFFQLTRARLEEDLFGVNANWNGLIAADSDDKPAGFCLYTIANINRVYNRTPIIQVDDIYVAPEYRKAKIGYKLIHALAVIAKRKNIECFNIWCVKNNEEGQGFYQKLGGQKLDFIDVYEIGITEFLANAK
jgi:ribosomal protein S18 acetylase RimI-like enzyme